MGKHDQGGIAEERFDQYLTERGYRWDKEPRLGTVKNPDRLITAGPHTVMAEVKSLATAGLLKDAVFTDTGTEGIRVSQPLSRNAEDALVSRLVDLEALNPS